MAANSNRAGDTNWGYEFMSLSPLQRQAVKLLSERRSYAEVARICQRSPATLTKWRNQTGFKRALQHLTSMHADEAYVETSNHLMMLSTKLADLAQTAEKDNDKINAARQLISFWQHLRQNLSDDIVHELVQRVEAIERTQLTGDLEEWTHDLSENLAEAPRLH